MRLDTVSYIVIHDLLQRRFKAAFEAYKERELPNLKVEVSHACNTA